VARRRERARAQRSGLALDRDLALLHRLQQRGLGPRRRAVDLVDGGVGETGPGRKRKRPASRMLEPVTSWASRSASPGSPKDRPRIAAKARSKQWVLKRLGNVSIRVDRRRACAAKEAGAAPAHDPRPGTRGARQSALRGWLARMPAGKRGLVLERLRRAHCSAPWGRAERRVGQSRVRAAAGRIVVAAEALSSRLTNLAREDRSMWTRHPTRWARPRSTAFGSCAVVALNWVCRGTRAGRPGAISMPVIFANLAAAAASAACSLEWPSGRPFVPRAE